MPQLRLAELRLLYSRMQRPYLTWQTQNSGRGINCNISRDSCMGEHPQGPGRRRETLAGCVLASPQPIMFLLNKFPNGRFHPTDVSRFLLLTKRLHWRTYLLGRIQKLCIGRSLFERGCFASCLCKPETIPSANVTDPGRGKL
jgi:hypothetical protein